MFQLHILTRESQQVKQLLSRYADAVVKEVTKRAQEEERRLKSREA